MSEKIATELPAALLSALTELYAKAHPFARFGMHVEIRIEARMTEGHSRIFHAQVLLAAPEKEPRA